MIGAGKILIVGGGIAGMSSAIHLARQGLAVDLIDLDPKWRVYGAGITITGPTLRAYRRLGLLEKIKQEGAVTNGTRLFHFTGHPIASLDEPILEDGLPATGGILRPILHRIMSDEVRASGVSVRLGVTVDRLEADDPRVDVTFSDGARAHYDLVVGADGIHSRVRSLLFPTAQKPRFTGQGSWRIVADRPAHFDKGEFYLGHANMVGIIACSPEKVYVFMLETDRERIRVEDRDQPAKVRALLADFGGNIAAIREKVGADSSIVHRPLETLFLAKPWHHGRVVLIGDAVHATTPHLASGAGIAVEDALVLAEELGKHGADVEGALAAFTDRRFERCRFVVESGLAIGEVQMKEGGSPQVGAMSGKALHRLAQEI
jgi:2-polyprenyl-6-methoxyphenol hydroxylase-like FAD-dependent oxidoreductase